MLCSVCWIWLLTFRHNLSAPSSRVKQSKEKCLETSITRYQPTMLNIPGEWRPFLQSTLQFVRTPTLWNPVVTMSTNRCDLQNCYILLVHCNYVFFMDLRTHRHY
jgi:hypothetical protein